MKAKICFESEIHKISKLPKTFEELTKLIPIIFHIQLPQSWTLQYTDSDGDKILLTDEKDYEELINPIPGSINGSSVVKIHVISTEIFRPLQAEPQEKINGEVIESKAEDDYQVIFSEEDKKEEVIKPEEQESVQKEDLQEEEKESVVNDSTAIEETMVKSEELVHNEVSKILNTSVKNQLEESIIDNANKAQEDEPVEESKEVMPEPVSRDDNKVMVDLKTLEQLVSGMMEKSLPKIIETTKELVAKDESKIILPAEEPLKAPSNKVIHYGVSCNRCYMTPIVGVRYKCTVCPNFDYCEACEEKADHIHDFVKMRQRDLLDIFKPQPVFPPKRWHKPKYPQVRFANPVEDEIKRQERRAEEKKLEELEQKAEKLLKCFPKEDICTLLVYISEAPEDMTLEELVENFKH